MIYSVFAIGITSVCCVALFFSQKKSEQQLAAQGNLFSEEVKPIWQTDVEVNKRYAEVKQRKKE